MVLTPLGAALIPVVLVVLWKGRRALFWATIVSIPFFFTRVVSVAGTNIRPFQIFGLLLILSYLPTWFEEAISGRKRHSWTTWFALTFIGVCLLSLIMPIFLSGAVDVAPVETPYPRYFAELQPLSVSLHNVTQLGYPFFGVLLFFALRRSIRGAVDVERIFRLYVAIAVVLAIYFVLYYVSQITGNRWMVEAFFSVVYGPTERLIFSEYDAIGGLLRPYSFVGEPGFSGAFLVYVFGFSIGSWIFSPTVYSKRRWAGWGVVLAVSLLLIVRSTTGFVGIVVALGTVGGIALFSTIYRGSLRLDRWRRATGTVLALTTLALVAVLAVEALMAIPVIELLVEQQLGKLMGKTGSGAIRLETLMHTIEEVFLVSPVLGVGYGSHVLPSLAGTLLGSTGLLGIVAFTGFNLSVVFRGIRYGIGANSVQTSALSVGAVVGLITLSVTLFVAKSLVSFVFGWYWLALAAVEGCCPRPQRRRGSAVHVNGTAPDTRVDP